MTAKIYSIPEILLAEVYQKQIQAISEKYIPANYPCPRKRREAQLKQIALAGEILTVMQIAAKNAIVLNAGIKALNNE